MKLRAPEDYQQVHHRSGPALAARLACRGGALRGSTAGIAPGYVQGNLAILPQDLATDFLRFCQLNPKPCPLIGLSDPGDPRLPALGEDLDIRTDLAGYRVWRDGEIVDEPNDVMRWWRDDLVAFVLGCSFSFEEALAAEEIPLRHPPSLCSVLCCPAHVEEGVRVPMYRTNVDCAPAGRFAGKLVVSMRPLRPADAIRAVQITSRFPAVHGAPVHIGLPQAIGIADLARPNYGDPVTVRTDELPVFWACGVTPQSVIETVKPPFAITHQPGSMLVTDIQNRRLAAF